MDDANFKRLDLSKLSKMSNGDRAKLFQAMTPQQQKQAAAAISAAGVAGTVAAKAKPSAAQAFSKEHAKEIYAKRRESVAGQASTQRG